MSGIIVYGFPLSTYVRTVRMALAEKGVPYALEPFEPHSEELKILSALRKDSRLPPR